MRQDLPGSVASTLARYLSLLDTHANDVLLGLYLVGSVALDDYHEGRSDVDFLALLKQPIDDATVAALERVHSALIDAPPYFDGLYVDARMLGAPPVTPSVVARSLDGAFEQRASFETNPAVWLCLARHGIHVRGPDPSTLSIAQDPLHLRRFLIENLQTYWTRWIAECRTTLARKRPGEDGNASALAWGVLGTARIAYTLATGDIVSKLGAGEWALKAYPQQHHPAIRDALAARRGVVSRFPIPRFMDALVFMECLIDDATRGSVSHG